MGQNREGRESQHRLFRRYIWLAELLYRTGGIALPEIQGEWRRSLLNDDRTELPERTFHDHRHAVESLFDCTIVCDKRDGSKYRFEEDLDERKERVMSYLLEAFSMRSALKGAEEMEDRILFDEVPSAQKYLLVILDAMHRSKRLKVSYQNFFSPRETTFEAEPLALRQFERRWYLVAASPARDGEIRIYGLDRLKSCEVLEESSFKVPKSFSAKAYFASLYGVSFSPEEPQVIRLKADAAQSKYLRTLPLHPSQKEEEETPEYSIFSYYLRPTYDLMQKILSFGSRVSVLQPENVRDSLRAEIRTMLSLYD